jgi:hypothetical protein
MNKSPNPPGVIFSYYFGAGGLVYRFDGNGLTLLPNLRHAANGVLYEV